MNPGIPAWALFALSIGGTWQSCRRSPDPERLRTVERITLATDSLIAACRAVDTTALARWQERYQDDRTTIETLFRDTLSPASAQAIGNYHRVMNGLLPATLNGMQRLRGHLDSARTRLGSLRHDLEQGLLDRTDEARYVLAEEQALDRARTATADLLRRCADILHTEQLYRPAVVELLPDTASLP